MMVAKHTPLLLALEGNLLASNLQNRGSSDKKEDWNSLLLRVQDACFTSELLGSLKCDCAGQLDESLKVRLAVPFKEKQLAHVSFRLIHSAFKNLLEVEPSFTYFKKVEE